MFHTTVYPSDGAFYIKMFTSAGDETAGPFDDRQDAELAAIRIEQYSTARNPSPAYATVEGK